MNMKPINISLADFRKNISSLWKESLNKNIKYVVMVHSKPVFEVIPIKDKSYSINDINLDINNSITNKNIILWWNKIKKLNNKKSTIKDSSILNIKEDKIKEDKIKEDIESIHKKNFISTDNNFTDIKEDKNNISKKDIISNKKKRFFGLF